MPKALRGIAICRDRATPQAAPRTSICCLQQTAIPSRSMLALTPSSTTACSSRPRRTRHPGKGRAPEENSFGAVIIYCGAGFRRDRIALALPILDQVGNAEGKKPHARQLIAEAELRDLFQDGRLHRQPHRDNREPPAALRRLEDAGLAQSCDRHQTLAPRLFSIRDRRRRR